MVKPATVRLFQERGLDVHRVIRYLEAKDERLKQGIEIDLFLITIAACLLK